MSLENEYDSNDDEIIEPINDLMDGMWLDNYLDKEKTFDKFYKEEVKKINLFFLYIDKQNNIIKILKEKQEIIDKKISKQKIIELIKEKKKILNKNFKLVDILQYNFNIENVDVKKFLNKKLEHLFLKKIKKIKDIYWLDTIPLFKKLNSLYCIFFEKKNHNTKKNRLKSKRKTKKKKLRELEIEKSEIIKIE